MEQNYSNTLENPKLTIDTMATQVVAVKKEVPLPYFFKDRYGTLCKVVTKNHFIKVISSPTASFISVSNVEYNLSEIGLGTAITEDEFEYAYSQALMYIQLIKENKEPSNEVDENVQIDEMLERRSA
jgi:hypothetical protein